MIMNETMNIVVVGHVDHGKSTIVGRLLADTGSLPEGKLEAVRKQCENNSRPFEYAFLLDALQDEQAQGITIDMARVFFKSARRDYIIIDAPGHIEFLKNMITGASRAESAVLVIDAAEGVQENSRRHAYMLSMLGIRNIIVVVNKMDLVSFDAGHFLKIQNEFNAFLGSVGVKAETFIPVSGLAGVNIKDHSDQTPWYQGPSVLEALDNFVKAAEPENAPFRMPVQAVYKFTRFGDNRRIVAGTVSSGRLSVGDEVMFLPSGKKSRVKSFEYFHGVQPHSVSVHQAVGFTLEEQIYITRGEVAVRTNENLPLVSGSIRTSVFWLGKSPLETGKEYSVKIGTAKVKGRLTEIHRIIDASNLSDQQKAKVSRHEVADCTFTFRNPVAFDLSESNAELNRFVIIDNFEISGGGIIRESVSEKTSGIRDHVMIRNYKWEKGSVSMVRRAERFSQRPTLILITGAKGEEKKNLAKSLEEKLFQDGRVVYYLGIGNVKYGVDADLLDRQEGDPREHVRRLSEIAHILLDAGMILIVTATDLNQEHIEIIRTASQSDLVETIWVGDSITTDLVPDLHITAEDLKNQDNAERIKSMLHDSGAIFRFW